MNVPLIVQLNGQSDCLCVGSYRRFNHFDELSSRFWPRSASAASADSMDNPAFTRSDELLHMRALDRPCCYHDDTLSLASASASSGCTGRAARLNTIYPDRYTRTHTCHPAESRVAFRDSLKSAVAFRDTPCFP